MNQRSTLAQVVSSLKEGAELRIRVATDCGPSIVEAARTMANCLMTGGTLFFFGNGGSAADAQHLAAEFVGRFLIERRALPAIALTTNSSILTAIGNDYGFEHVFARQIQALGRPNDVAIGISTSGNSPNVLAAIDVAAKQGLKTIALTGNDGGALAGTASIPIIIRSTKTPLIQECHIAVGHLLCELVERELCAQGTPKDTN